MDFDLQFDPAFIPALAEQYMAEHGEKDRRMEEAGRLIWAGQRTRKNLEIIYRWKAARAVRHLLRNTDADVDRILRLAIESIDERSAMVSLIRVSSLGVGLHGVQCPVASAILTAIDPNRFTVIDYKALNSLGQPKDAPSVDFYLEYLNACRRIALETMTNIRTLDRALWQWWKNKEESEKSAHRLA
jgi:hypothetical protein